MRIILFLAVLLAAGVLPADESVSRVLSEKAAELVKSEKFEDALHLIRRAREEWPENLFALYLEGRCLRGLKKTSEAIDLWREFLLRSKDSKDQTLGRLRNEVVRDLSVIDQTGRRLEQLLENFLKECAEFAEKNDATLTQAQAAALAEIGAFVNRKRLEISGGGRESLPAPAPAPPRPADASVPPPIRRIVSLVAPYPQSYPGAETDRISVQYAVIEIAKQAGLRYNWEESFKNTDPLCRAWVRPAIRNMPADEAIRSILKPFGLTFVLRGDEIILQKPEKPRGRGWPDP